MDNEKKQELLTQRKYLLKELLDTEQKYIEDMDLFFEVKIKEYPFPFFYNFFFFLK